MKKTCLINQKAQALTELAVFGSLLLFCLSILIHYGLQMNYQQQMQMQAFRKAMKMAYYKQGPNSSASIAMVKDKPIVDPRDRWGLADRVAVGGGASVTWSSNLNSLYAANISETPDDRDLPRTYIEVNNGKAGGTGLSDADINDNLDNMDPLVAENKGAFSTAGFRRLDDCQGQDFGIYIENSDHKLGPNEYFMIPVNADDIKVYEDEQDPTRKNAMYEYAGLKRSLGSLDLAPYDGKLKQVEVVAVAGTDGDDCENGYCGTLKQILYVDSAAGRIDTYYTEVKPWDKDKTLADKQGLLAEYNKEINYGSGAKIVTEETVEGISTETNSDATQKITHKIKLNDGSVREVTVDFNQPPKAYNWEVSYGK